MDKVEVGCLPEVNLERDGSGHTPGTGVVHCVGFGLVEEVAGVCGEAEVA